MAGVEGNVSAYRRFGVSAWPRVGRVGLRSRATGVARLERPETLPNSRVFARVFTFSGRATPDARERGPYHTKN